MSEGTKHDVGKPRWSLLPQGTERWTQDWGEAGTVPLPLRAHNLILNDVWMTLSQRWGDPNDFLTGVVRILTHGADKYGDFNWRLVESSRYYDAYRRHLHAGWFSGGKCYDSETGEHHLLHAGACILIMKGLDLEAKRNEGK